MKRTKWIAFLCFAFLMAGLGANDALRGIFAPVFQKRYEFKREPAFVDCYYQLCGKSAVFKHRREASGSVSQKECGCGGNWLSGREQLP